MPNYYKVSDNGQLEIDWLQLEQEFCQEFVEAIRTFTEKAGSELVRVDRYDEEQYRAVLKNDYSVTLINCREGYLMDTVRVCSIAKSELEEYLELFKGVE